MQPFFSRLAACATLLFCLPLHAQPAAETAAARVLGEWLAAFNSGEMAQLKAFDAKYKPQPPIAGDEAFRKMTGGFSVVRIESNQGVKLVALVKEKNSENMGRLTLVVSADEPPRVLDLNIRLVPPQAPGQGGPPAPIARMTLEETIAATNKRVDELVAADQFAGALLVAQNGKTVMSRAVGMSDRQAKVANTLETKFRIGSMNKMFTSIAALQLLERGKLSLEDAVGKHLPDYPNKAIADKVTIRHLLTHMGGTGDIFGAEFEKNRLSLQTPGDYVKLFGSRAPLFEPGTDSRYSNYGYVLLGALIEKVSGQSYDDYVQKNILAVAGMQDTGALPESQAVAHRAIGYMRPQGKWVPNGVTLPWSGSPAGGGYSTVGDMLRFALALEAGKLVSKATLADATTVRQKSYGFGFVIRGTGDWKAFGHGGGGPGMNGELRIIPAQGYVVVALANVDPPSAEQLVGFVAARLPTI